MSKHDRVMEIFLNECKEILEEIAPKFLSLEETPDDKDLINDIFRGVHTLKGNANSFGFVKLGEFVHHFEDLLSLYRKEEHTLQASDVDLFIRSFDVVGGVFDYEEQGLEGYPLHYETILQEIKAALHYEEAGAAVVYETLVEATSYAHENMHSAIAEKMARHVALDKISLDGKRVYEVQMRLDSDIYLRGYNHQLFFKLLGAIGEILYTHYSIDKDVPGIEAFNTEISYIKSVTIYLLSEQDEVAIADVFEFIAQEHEISIAPLNIEALRESIQKSDKEHEDKEPNNQSALKSNDKAKSSIRVESAKLDELFDSIGELVIAQSYISQNEQIRSINNSELNGYLEMLTKSTRLIQNKVMGLRMIPIRDTFLKMKRVVRDVSLKTNKAVELYVSGEDTEIDKTMVDRLSEPLIHLLRNSVDHGIEADASIREASGKEPCGNVYLSASHKGSSFVIEIRDDGRGVDTKAILQKAIEKGFAKEGVNYSADEIINFLFSAGFSTAASITDISGRGVGLDAVKQSIEDMRGKIVVESELGVGTSFKIILPLTLAIIDGLNIQVHEEMFIVPTLSVVESFSPTIDDVHQVKGKGEFINYRGEILPIVRLNQLLNLSQTKTALEESTFICIDHERGRYILQVDELLGRQQVVIKSLGVLSANTKEISGAAILGNGNIALILNTEGIRDYLDVVEDV